MDWCCTQMKKTMSDCVIIAGGGVVGLALSVALAARGIRSRVLEKSQHPGTIDRGDVIHAGAEALLHTWGVLTDDTDSILHVPEFHIIGHKGTKLFSLNFESDLKCEAGLSVMRHPDIEHALERAASKSGLVDIRRGVMVANWITKDNRVEGVITDDGVEHRGCFSVLAAGANNALGGPFDVLRCHTYKRHFYNVLIDQVPGIQNQGCYYLSNDGVMIMVPLPHGKLRVGFQVSGVHDTHRYRDPKTLCYEIRRRLSDFPEVPLRIHEGHYYKLAMQMAGRFCIPGAAVIGDAAHTVHPTGGQGMNVGFIDAERLAETLFQVRANPTTEIDRLAAFGIKRKREVRRIQRRTHILGIVGERVPDCLALTTLVLSVINRLRPLKHWIGRRFVRIE